MSAHPTRPSELAAAAARTGHWRRLDGDVVRSVLTVLLVLATMVTLVTLVNGRQAPGSEGAADRQGSVGGAGAGGATPVPVAVGTADPATSSGPCAAPGPPGDIAPRSLQRILAGGDPVVDSQGREWSPSPDWSGGRVSRRTDPLTGTGSPGLYELQRAGASSLGLTVPGTGTYAVNVSAADSADTAAGDRVFDVLANGMTVAYGQDVIASVGPDKPFHLLFTVPVAGRCLNLRFVPVRGEPLVANVEVGYVGPSQEEREVWADEFDGPADAPVDGTRWIHEVGGVGWGNDELQSFTDDPASSHLDGHGSLVVAARHTGGPVGSPSARYESARLITKDRASFRYGRVQVRATAPRGAGLWAGVWALGTDIDTVGFPRSGEIDFLELVGGPDRLLGFLHGDDGHGGTFSLGRGIDTGMTGVGDYETLWTPIGIAMSVDRRTYASSSPSDLAPGVAWPFDKHYYLLITLSVGGSMPGPPDAQTSFPASFTLEHVRVIGW